MNIIGNNFLVIPIHQQYVFGGHEIFELFDFAKYAGFHYLGIFSQPHYIPIGIEQVDTGKPCTVGSFPDKLRLYVVRIHFDTSPNIQAPDACFFVDLCRLGNLSEIVEQPACCHGIPIFPGFLQSGNQVSYKGFAAYELPVRLQVVGTEVQASLLGILPDLVLVYIDRTVELFQFFKIIVKDQHLAIKDKLILFFLLEHGKEAIEKDYGPFVRILAIQIPFPVPMRVGNYLCIPFLHSATFW